jgi:Tol biopolymer transport system component
MRPDGTEQRRLTEGPSLNVFPRFSPDGRRIAYHRQDREGDSIWVVNIDGSGRHRVLREENDLSPGHCCWSPDGQSLACTVLQWQRDEQGRKFLGGGDSHPRIVIIDAEGKDRCTLVLPHAMAIEWPTWR